MEEDLRNYIMFLNGDLVGFENLVIAYKNQLIYFIMKYIKDLHIAEDLAQDTFVDIYVYKERYNKKQSFKTYLFTIGRNKAIDYIRKNKREITLDIAELNKDEYYELEQSVVSKEEQYMVRNAMISLKKEYQLAIVLIDFYAMSYEEAAIILGKTLPQMKILIYRARKALGKILLKEGYGYEE